MNVNNLIKELKQEHQYEDEVDSLNAFVEVLKSNGFNILSNDNRLLNLRGWMQTLRLNRCSQHKKFFFNSVEDELKEFFKYVKKINK